MIRDLADDDWITEPGFYRMSLDRHHDQPCMSPATRAAMDEDGIQPPLDAVSVTSGVLRRMELQTPADVWAFHRLNRDRWEQKDRSALRWGRAMAAFIEGGVEEVERHFWVRGHDAPRRPTAAQEAAYDAGKGTDAGTASVEFWRSMEADPRDELEPAAWQTILEMGAALIQDPAACAVMAGEPEVTMAWQDDQTGIWVLSRPDTVSFDGMMSDYKRINTQGRPFTHWVVDRRITDHGYHMQMALGAEAFQRLTGSAPDAVGIVAQWDARPYHVILREIADEELGIGRWQNARALARFAECYRSGSWPGPGADTASYQMPPAMRDRLVEEMNTAYAAP